MRAASIIFLLLVASWGVAAQAAVGFSSGACEPRDAVSEAVRQPYEKAALNFVSDVVKGDFLRARSQMRDELRNALSVQAFADSVKVNTEAFKLLGPLSVSRSYLLDVGTILGNGQQFALCQADMKTPMSSPHGRVTLVTDHTPTEAYVLVEGKGPTGTWVFTLWMIRLQNAWLISHFHAASSSRSPLIHRAPATARSNGCTNPPRPAKCLSPTPRPI